MAIAEETTDLTDRLRLLERQWRDLVLVSGLGRLLVSAGLLTGLFVFADLFFNLFPVVRAAGLLGIVIVCGWQLATRLILPLSRGVTEQELADWLEQNDRRWQERLRTSLELDSVDAPESRAARLMQRQVRRETLALLEDTEFAEVLPPESAWRRLGAGLVILVILLAPFAVWRGGYGLEWQRLVLPFGNWGWGRNYRITADETRLVIARGSEGRILARAKPYRNGRPQPEALTLLWRGADQAGWDERRLLWSADENAYAAVLPRISTDTQFRILGPDAESPRYQLQVVDPPRLLTFQVAIDPPAYTGQPSRVGGVERELQVHAGSRLRWTARFDRRVETAALVMVDPQGQERAEEKFTVAGTDATAVTRPQASGEYLLRWRSPEGFVVEEPLRRLIVLPDQPPHVRLDGPASLMISPEERHELSIVAQDDYGLTVTEVVVELPGGVRRVVSLPRSPVSARNFSGSWLLDLADLGVQHGQVVTVKARVVDNCAAPSPQERWSDPQLLVVSRTAASSATRELAADTQSTREELQKLMRELADQQQQLKEIHQKTAAATVRRKDAEQEQPLETLQKKQKEFTANFDAWRQNLPQEGAWGKISETAGQLQQRELAAIEQKLEAAETAEVRDAIEDLSQTLDSVATARKKLQLLDDQIRELGNLRDELDRLAQLANRADRLADALERRPAEDPGRVNPDGARSSQTRMAGKENPPGNASEERPASARTRTGPVAEASDLARDLEQLLATETELRAALEAFEQQKLAQRAPQLAELGQAQRELSDTVRVMADDAQGRGAGTEPADAGQAENLRETADSARQQGEQLRQRAEELATRLETLTAASGEQNGGELPASQAAAALEQLRRSLDQGQLTAAAEQAAEAFSRLQNPEANPEAASENPASATGGRATPSGMQDTSGSQASSGQAPAGQASAVNKAAAGQPSSGQLPSDEIPAGQSPDGQEIQRLAADLEGLRRELAQASASEVMQQQALAAAEERLTAATRALAAEFPAGSPAKPVQPADRRSSPGERLQSAADMMQAAAGAQARADLAQAAPRAEAAAELLRQLADEASRHQAAREAGEQAASMLPAKAGSALAEAAERLNRGQQSARSLSGNKVASATAQQESGNTHPSSSSGSSSRPGADEANAPSGQPAAHDNSGSAPSTDPMPSADQPRTGPEEEASLKELAENYRQAAEALRRAARSANGTPQSQGPESRNQQAQARSQSADAPGPGSGNEPNEAAVGDAPASLRAAGVVLQNAPMRGWGRLETELKTNVLEGGRQYLHPEYQDQIRHYFQTIARTSSPRNSPPAPAAAKPAADAASTRPVSGAAP